MTKKQPKPTIALIGSNGQLGTDLLTILAQTADVIPLTHKNIEITDPKSVLKVMGKYKPDIIINTAAYTRVDEAESSPDKAFLINAIGTKNLVEFCKKNKTVFVLYSTDYVFGQDSNRKKPYSEDDVTGPVNTYGISKLAGEEYVKTHLQKYFIIRTTGLFGIAGSSGKGYNFIELMLRLSSEQKEIKVVNDQVSSPTYTKELAYQTAKLLKTNKFGLYHITSRGGCSWYEFAKEIFKLTKKKVKVIPVTKKEWHTPADRPHYSVLGNKKLNKLGINEMSTWKKALKEYLKEKKYL